MGYLPQYKKDIFLSYKHVSNELSDKWVDTFEKTLKNHLMERVGQVDFWRDTSIQAGDDWMQRILEGLDTTAIFLAVLVPVYLSEKDSPVCIKELDHFLKRVRDPNETIKPVIIPVYKTLVSPDDPEHKIPHELKNVHDIRFFQQDPLLEFIPEGDGEVARKFHATLAQLAQYLGEQLKSLRGELRKRMAERVYLGAVPAALREERETLRADLLQRGYWVVPEQSYFWNSMDLEPTMASELGASALCVHLIGAADPYEPEMPEHQKLELERAVEVMKQKGKPAPLVWIKPGTEGDAVKSLIAYVKEQLPNHGGEWCEGSLEDFKSLIVSKLPTPKLSSAESAAPKAGDLALIVERSDVSAARTLQATLVNALECDVQVIQIPESAASGTAPSITVPRRCGKCIVFWGTQTEDRLRDLLAMEAVAPYRNKSQTCVYIAEPDSDEKRNFMLAKVSVIRASSATHEAELLDFNKEVEMMP
jgi:hypothetical protein